MKPGESLTSKATIAKVACLTMKKGRKSPANRATDPPQRHERRIGSFVAAAVVVAIALLAGYYWARGPSAAELVKQGRAQLERRKFPAALELAEQALRRSPDSNEALLLAGQVAAAMGEFSDCLAYLDRVPDDGSASAVDARNFVGDVLLLHFKRLSAAADQFRRALRQDAENVSAHDHLAFALGVGARPWEQIPHRLMLIEYDRFEPAHLQSLSLGDYAIENDNLAEEYRRGDTADAAPRLMLARVAFESQDYLAAEAMLRSALRDDPSLIEGHVKLGQVLLKLGADDRMKAWQAGLPPEADKHPGIWVVRGEWAQRQHEPRESARCFWEAIRLNPEHEQANYQLGQQLVALGRPRDAAPFLARAALLQEYVNAVKVAMEGGQPAQFLENARLAEQLGLVWEAYAWSRILLDQHPDDEQLLAQCDQLRMKFTSNRQSRSIAVFNPARGLDLSAYPLPAWDRAASLTTAASRRNESSLTMLDQAPSAGLRFQYINGGDPRNHGIAHMYEFSGGGLGVLDYDGDGWPDLYLSQGCDWATRQTQSEHLDCLFRNLGDGQFEEISAEARLRETSFSQGVTVGDFDNDGFADVFVANIGANRFYRNNGDGTFDDITTETQTAGSRWTSSCVLADFSGDGLPDLYTVNYLGGENIFTMECARGGGRGECFPQYFPASQDQLYWNQGDGRFTEVTDTAGIRLENGKGLGVAAVDFTGSGRLSLFVANDSTTNFLLINQTEPGGSPLFSEEALLRGVAMNDVGKTEACMGVAVGDADGDGWPDLLVTNFFLETNTLYRQLGDGQFADQTQFAGLLDTSKRQLGFGTQFLDVDLDGAEDLFVANGHIGDYRREGTPYRMPPQLFQNVGQGKFLESAGPLVGDYFQGEYLGRAVARLDWNKDGGEDLVVGHLDAPVALLTNTTTPRGRFLAVHLRGTISARDAIGTTVQVKLPSRTLVRQLVAGDGYQASNERRLVFGLGDAERIESLSVRWPTGEEQTFMQISLDTELMIVQGRARPVPLGRQ